MRRLRGLEALPVALLLFGSGLSALVYQIAWQREFRMIFGSSTAASAAVLTIFIGGMGIGGLTLGKRADAHPRPLRLYAGLEILIAAFAAITPPLFDIARAAYIRTGGTLGLGTFAGTALRLALAALVLAAPTWLMGGTLPAAARAVQSESDARRRTVGLLYGANTLGAVTGCVLSTFWLLERLGTRASLWSACVANAVVALIAVAISRGAPQGGAALAAPAPERPRQFNRFVLIAAGVVGFAFFLMELVWYRMLGPLLGGTVFTFGLILAVALLGIGAGGLAYAIYGAGRRAEVRGFAFTCLFEALAIAIPFGLGDRIALLALALQPDGGPTLAGCLPGWLAVTAIVVFPAAFIAGIQYPLLIALLGEGKERVGAEVGAAAASNTAGAMLGSLSGGFALLPALSATGCWRAMGALLTALGAYALVIAARSERELQKAPAEGDIWRPNPRLWLRRLIGPAIGVFALACLVARGPTAAWRHSPIGASRVDHRALESPNAARSFLHDARRSILWETEGVESSVAIDASDGFAMVVNGKVDGNARGDAPTQVMGGLLGAILHPRPRSAMVIGLGTGSTAGWLGAIPSIERVDVAELEASMVRIARDCAPVNERAADNPKVRILIGDARETLLTTPSRYDIIFSEPSNPYRAGVASLFTTEYYRAVAARLEQGGVFLQWVQLYEIDAGTVRALYATLRSVFPSVESWRLGASDLVLVASAAPIQHDVAALRLRVQAEPYQKALSVSWRTHGLEGLFAHYLARPVAADMVAEGGYVNTDDRNQVEFAFARHVGNFARVGALLDEVRARGYDKPEVVGGEVDWSLVQEERLMALVAEGIEPEVKPGLPVDMEVRADAAVNYVAANLEGAIAKWQFQERAPIGLTEIELVAEGSAESGLPGAEAAIEKLRAIQPIEADAALARLRRREGKRAEAADLLARAFVAFRADPWPSTAMMQRALDMACDLCEEEPSVTARILDALREPFAVHSLEAARRTAVVLITQKLPTPEACAAAFHRLEPSVPWDLDTLRARQDCYQRAGDERRHDALRDAARFASCDASKSWSCWW